ncbi:MAG: protein kinase family protein [Lachnospiraceae bacterium]|nr:protein kinase family protein [Lachnospiraceae bacterium]
MLTLKDMAYVVWCVPKSVIDRAKIIFYNVKFHIYQKSRILRRLNDEGFCLIEPYKEKEWALFPVFKIYYTALKDGQKVFIKIGNYANVIDREVRAINFMKENSLVLKEYIPILVDYSTQGAYPYIAESFIESVSSGISKEYIEKIARQLIIIRDELFRMRIIHMDIRAKNILVDDSGCVYLIDFGMSYIQDKIQEDTVFRDGILPSKFWGLGGRRNPDRGLYDDSYSILAYLKEIYPDFKRDFKEYWKELNIGIGKFEYQFKKIPRKCR